MSPRGGEKKGETFWKTEKGEGCQGQRSHSSARSEKGGYSIKKKKKKKRGNIQRSVHVVGRKGKGTTPRTLGSER